MLALFNRLINPAHANAFWIGIALMVLGNLFFALNDTLGKVLLGTFAVGQLLAIRSAGAFLVLGPMLFAASGTRPWRIDRPWLQALRVVLTTADSGLFYAAVAYLPLADVITFYMAGPIYVAAMSYFLPNERIGWQRWLAILGGFVGVVIALGPSFAHVSLETIYALVGGFAYAGSLMMNKVLSKTSDTVLGTLQALGALAVGSGFALYSWTAPSPLDFVLLLLLGVIACLAHLFVTRSVKLAPVSVLAPFQYTLLLWGIIFGIIVFGDVPSREILIGAGIIVLAGLFLLYSERRTREGPASADSVMKDFP